jgi:hypothetical protein
MFRFNRRISQAQGMLFYRLLQHALPIGTVPYKKLTDGRHLNENNRWGYGSEMDTPLARSTDSHAVTSRRQRRTVFVKLLSLRGILYLHGGAERRPGDGRCGRDGPAAG